MYILVCMNNETRRHIAILLLVFLAAFAIARVARADTGPCVPINTDRTICREHEATYKTYKRTVLNAFLQGGTTTPKVIRGTTTPTQAFSSTTRTQIDTQVRIIELKAEINRLTALLTLLQVQHARVAR